MAQTDVTAAGQATFATMGKARRDRYAKTPGGLVHLTLSELALVAAVEQMAGEVVSKAVLAENVGCTRKTASRLLTILRREGVLCSEEVTRSDGGRDANAYRIAPGVRPATTAEIDVVEEALIHQRERRPESVAERAL